LGRPEYEYSGSIQLGNVPTYSVFLYRWAS